MLGLPSDGDISNQITVDYDAHPRQIILDVLYHCQISPIDLMTQGEYLHKLLRVRQWEEDDPRRLTGWTAEYAKTSHRKTFYIDGFMTGVVTTVLEGLDHTSSSDDVSEHLSKVMQGCAQDDIKTAFGSLRAATNESTQLSQDALGQLNASLANPISRSTTEPVTSKPRNLDSSKLFVVYTSFLRQRTFLLCRTSDVVAKGDQLLCFPRSRLNLLARQSASTSNTSAIIGSAICVKARHQSSGLDNTDISSFSILTNAAECNDMRQGLTLQLDDKCFSALLG